LGFVISDGALKSIGETSSGIISPHMPRGTRLTAHLALSYSEIYRTQPAVRTVVDFLARNIAGLSCKSYERISATDRERLDPDSARMAAMLEETPNPRSTAFRLWQGTVSDKAIFDVAFWTKTKVDAKTWFVRRIPVRRVQPYGGSWLDADRYRIIGQTGEMIVPAENMVIFNGYDPDDDRVGCSPLETIRLILAEEYQAASYRAQLWANGARSPVVISRPLDAPEWETGDRERFQRDFRAAYSGDGPEAGGWPVLEEGMTAAAVGITPKEAQYVESRKLTREEVAAVYHIAPPLVGILDHATFSNIAEQHIQLYVDTLGPWCDSLSQEVNGQLVPDFYPTRKVYVEFDIAGKLAGDFERQATVFQAAIGGPWLTVAEGRAKMNLPFIEGTDQLITPLNVTVGGQANPQDSVPDPNGNQPPGGTLPAGPAAPPAADPAAAGKARAARGKAAAPPAAVDDHVNALQRTFVRQQTAVLSAWKKAKAAGSATKAAVEVHDIFDRGRWDVELAADLLVVGLPLVAEVGAATAATFEDGPGFDQSKTANYVAAQTAGTASSVNQTTQSQLSVALGDHDVETALAAVFALAIASRALSVGRGQAANLAGWATVEAGHQLGAPEATKTWVTGADPRPSHAAMDGQTVPLDGHFSNGARWPADAVNLGVDDIAGCNCSLIVTPKGALA
jgi:HK97 family phage portal protein